MTRPSAIRAARRGGVRPIFGVIAGLLFAMASLFSQRAQADELEDFGRAQAAYERGEYRSAARLFEALVGGEVPVLRNEILVLESYKYLGAAYLFEDRREDAERQFTRLLELSPDYALDPVAFPAAIQETFSAVRRRIQAELAEREAAREAAERERRQRALDRILAQQRRIARLEALAREETVEQRSSRWLAMLPFGVGQFQNGNRGLAIALLSAQVFLATTSLSTFFYFQFLQSQPSGSVPSSLRRGVGITNRVSTAALAGVAIAGVIEAQVRFEPVRRTTRQRELPEDLRNLDAQPLPESPSASLQLQLGAGYAGFRLSF